MGKKSKIKGNFDFTTKKYPKMPKKDAKKKTGAENIISKLALVMKSGKATLGFKSTIKAIRSGKAKLVFIANNCPPIRYSQLKYYAGALARIKTYDFNGDNNVLGTACGKYHRCTCMAILEAGDSDILNVLEKE